jgi:hypothetical protein
LALPVDTLEAQIAWGVGAALAGVFGRLARFRAWPDGALLLGVAVIHGVAALVFAHLTAEQPIAAASNRHRQAVANPQQCSA